MNGNRLLRSDVGAHITVKGRLPYPGLMVCLNRTREILYDTILCSSAGGWHVALAQS